MPTDAPYRGSITREQWLLRETRTVARLRTDAAGSGESLELADVVDLAAEENIFQYPTEREVKSIARACWRRLDALSDDPALRNRLIGLVATGTPDQARQVNLYALARDNRIVWEFLAAVVARKLQGLDESLSKREIIAFLEGLRAQDERAARWSDATLNKIRQVLTACLVECGMYDRRAETLLRPLLDLTLEQAMRANGDQALLPAFGAAE
ncbi:MAG: DUF1819 family protein [Coriobacteriia bacterium]|nr:DUF1819 family protein [Coriobacteriia bacterium]